jgi:transposase
MRDGLGASLQRTRPRSDDLPSNRWKRPPFAPTEAQQIVDAVNTTVPREHNLPGNGWTLKKLRQWTGEKLKRFASRGTLYRLLRAAKLSWKKCKKLLGKRNSVKRAAYLERFLNVYQEMVRGENVLIFVDESHFHRDLELGYTWGPIGKRIWRISDCPPLADRINWFGAYNFTDGECFIWAEGACNKETTAEFLHRIDEWVRRQGRRVIIVWDGAPWHRAKMVQQAAEDLGIELMALPGYSPDLNPIEGLWKWMREEVTQLECHPNLKALFDRCKEFIESINKCPLELINRLWPRFELDPQEKTRIFSLNRV